MLSKHTPLSVPYRTDSRAYFDHAATSPLRSTALHAMTAAWMMIGNPSAQHSSGRNAKAVLEDARESIAADLGAHPSEVIFTSGGSEADSIAVLGGMATTGLQGVISAVEHPAVLTALSRGAIAWPVDQNGALDPDWISPEKIGVVSVMSVNNETGLLLDLNLAAELANRSGALLHTDAVQAVGHLPFCFAEQVVDLASVSAHKFGGPVGIGVLLARRQVKLSAIGLGGGQERSLRSGTQPVALASGFAAALRETLENFEIDTARYRDWQTRILNQCLLLEGTSSVTNRAESAPHILNITFSGCRAEDLLVLLDRAGIDASAGSACQGGVHRPSTVLLAMGIDSDAASASLRFSFGHTTTEENIDQLLTVLPEVVRSARAALGTR